MENNISLILRGHQLGINNETKKTKLNDEM